MRVILQNHFKSLPQANDSEHLAQVPLPPSKSVGPKSRKYQRKSNATARALSQSVAMRYIEGPGQQPLDFFGLGKRALGAGPRALVYGNPHHDSRLNWLQTR